MGGERAQEERLGRVGGLHGAGGCDEAVVGVREVFHLVDNFTVMCLEAKLAAERPDAADPGIVGEAAQHGVVGGCQVFKDGIAVADSVGGEVCVLGEGLLFVLEDQVPHELRGELEDDGAVAFLGRKGKNVGDQEMEWEGSGRRKVAAGGGGVEAGLDDFLEHDIRDSIGGGGRSDRETQYAYGSGT
jgi:hypothetical protein